MNCCIENGTILCIDSKKTDLHFNIDKVLYMKGLYIVLLHDSYEKLGYIDVSKQPDNNVIALDQNGNEVWNIKDIMQDVLKGDQLYTNINVTKDGHLEVTGFIGIAFTINVISKKVISRRITK